MGHDAENDAQRRLSHFCVELAGLLGVHQRSTSESTGRMQELVAAFYRHRPRASMVLLLPALLVLGALGFAWHLGSRHAPKAEMPAADSARHEDPKTGWGHADAETGWGHHDAETAARTASEAPDTGPDTGVPGIIDAATATTRNTRVQSRLDAKTAAAIRSCERSIRSDMRAGGITGYKLSVGSMRGDAGTECRVTQIRYAKPSLLSTATAIQHNFGSLGQNARLVLDPNLVDPVFAIVGEAQWLPPSRMPLGFPALGLSGVPW